MAKSMAATMVAEIKARDYQMELDGQYPGVEVIVVTSGCALYQDGSIAYFGGKYGKAQVAVSKKDRAEILEELVDTLREWNLPESADYSEEIAAVEAAINS